MNFADKLKIDYDGKGGFLQLYDGELVESRGKNRSKEISLFELLTTGTAIVQDSIDGFVEDPDIEKNETAEKFLKLLSNLSLEFLAELACRLYDVDISIESELLDEEVEE